MYKLARQRIFGSSEETASGKLPVHFCESNLTANFLRQRLTANMAYLGQARFRPIIDPLPVKRESHLNSGVMIQTASTPDASTRLIGAPNNKRGCLSHLANSQRLRTGSLLRSLFHLIPLRGHPCMASNLLAILLCKERYRMQLVRLIQLHLR